MLVVNFWFRINLPKRLAVWGIAFMALCLGTTIGIANAQVQTKLWIDKGASVSVNVSDTLSLQRYFKAVVLAEANKGYLGAEVEFNDLKGGYVLSRGTRYGVVLLKASGLPPLLVQQLSKKGKRAFDKSYSKALNPSEITALETEIIALADANGYAFAQVRLDSLQMEDHNVEDTTTGTKPLKSEDGGIKVGNAVLVFRPGPSIAIDTIITEGSLRIKERFLADFTKLKPGATFSTLRVLQAQNLIAQQPFSKVAHQFTVRYIRNKAYPTFYLDKNPANQISGLIGFLPNQQDKGKLLVTGDFTLKLYNLFNSGKGLQVNWQKIKDNSQRLDLGFQWPAFFGTALEPFFDFGLQKEDSLFVNIRSKIGANYCYGSGFKLGFFVQQNSSNTLARLPDAQLQKLGLLGYTYTGYGAQVSYQQLDNVLFPTTGFRYSAEASVGNKTFTKSIVGREGRDSLSKTNLQLMAKASVERYSLVGKNLVLVLKGGAGYLGTGQGKGGIGASNLLATNELFRLGGLTTIRGFAENFFFASSYGTATAELRAFTAPQTFFSVFVDQGLIGQQNFLGNNVSYCTGIGVGVSFTVPAGLFNLNYALGQTAGLPFSFDTSKVHFGYVARF